MEARINHHFIITSKEEEKLRYVYIFTSLQQGGMKKVAVFIYHPFVIARKDEKSCGMYISSLHYNKEGKKSCSMYISSLYHNKEG